MRQSPRKPDNGAAAATPRTPFTGNISDGDVRLLRLFKNVADAGSFRAAEAKLNKSKSSISTDIRNLEDRLGLRLCERGRSGFALTTEGLQVYAAVKDLTADLERFGERVSSVRRRLSGELVIYVIDNLVTHRESPLAETLSDFHALHPDVFIHLVSAAESEVERVLLAREADIGIAILGDPRPGLEAHALFEESIRLYCGKRHPLFARKDQDLDLAELSRHKLIDTSLLGRLVETELPRSNVLIGCRADNLDARAIAILSGCYIGALPDRYAEQWLSAGQMRVLFADEIVELNTLNVLWNGTGPRSLAATEFLALLLARAS